MSLLTANLSSDNRLEFLYELYLRDVDIRAERVLLLKKHKYIEVEKAGVFEREYKHKPTVQSSRDMQVKALSEQVADEHVDIVFSDGTSDVENVLTAEEYVKEENKLIYKGVAEIKTSEWMPAYKELLSYPDDFIAFIDSINSSFANMIHYVRFAKYEQQSMMWLSENKSMSDYESYDEQLDFAREEKRRCTENTLYFLNRYHTLKEGDARFGRQTYRAWKCQSVICFLFDSGYNIMIGKMRQIGFTSTLGGCCIKRLTFNKSYFIKFITENLEKGEEIFEDKIKFPFYNLPAWMRPTVNNDRDNLLRLFYKPGKGSIGGVDSKLQVVAPRETAINGGAPNLVMIDEIGTIPILTEMMNEGRPALFWINPDTAQMEMRRQLICWGTGGNSKTSGAAMEREFKAALDAWKNRNFHYGIVPLFFDCFAKPGMTEDFYHKEKLYYYAKGTERAKVQFHQAYPTSVDDMFLVSSETLIDIEEINACIRTIHKLPAIQQGKRGFFKPRYDMSSPAGENSDVPYKIIGCDFVPLADTDTRATVTIYSEPERAWRNRYFQGTDPIYSETGHSKMSSAIWDSELNETSAVVNYREDDYRYCYLQSMLLGFYYDFNNNRHLIENNVGSGFMDYIDNKGFWRTLVPNKMIATHLQSPTGARMGIRKHGNTAKFIINSLQEMLHVHKQNIRSEEFFYQLKTYVRKTTITGHESFKLESPKYHYDDVIDAVTYAYICAKSFAHLKPYCEGEGDLKTKKTKYRYALDSDFNVVLEKKLK